MISYALIDREDRPGVEAGRREAHPELEIDDRIRSVELTFEQHFGLRVWDDEKGDTWFELREGAGWSPPQRAREFMRRALAGEPHAAQDAGG